MNKEMQHEIQCLKLNNLGKDRIIYDRLPFSGVSRKKAFLKLASILKKSDLCSAALQWTVNYLFFRIIRNL